MKKIFIDGSAGTTGLKIFDRLKNRDDIELIILPDDKRKDVKIRQEALNSADIAFLCLPDDAAIESVNLVENNSTILIDTSTAHRCDENWAYGFPELGEEMLEKLKKSNRIAVPGCHASGFIALVHPLIKNGFIDKDICLSCHSITGFSGGGKKMIAEYEDKGRNAFFDSPRQYALGQNHKHLKEMKKITGLTNPPIFCPIVADYYSGMLVTVPLFKKDLLNNKGIGDIKQLYKSIYNTEIVSYSDDISENGLMASNSLSGLDSMQITVEGNEDRILLIARYDNLGKGASGAAIECMNIKMEAESSKELILK